MIKNVKVLKNVCEVKEKRFSVIIISYNLEEFISRAIESVINQKYKNYELIIIDNNSTDESWKIINKYKRKYQFTVIKNKLNEGVGKARNIGVGIATGEYIIYLDGDDTLYNEDTLYSLNKTIGRSKTDIIYCGYQEIGGNNKLYIADEHNSTKEARISCDITMSSCSKCWRREFLIKNDIRYEEDIFYEDQLYSIKGTILAKRTKYGEYPIINYYRNEREGSIMHTASVKKCSDMYRCLARIMDLYEETESKLRPYLISFIVNETEYNLKKIPVILKAIEAKECVSVFPKREFEFKQVFETIKEDVREEKEDLLDILNTVSGVI